jgi:hypothetical protein
LRQAKTPPALSAGGVLVSVVMDSSWWIGLRCCGAGGCDVVFALALVMSVNLFTVPGLKDLNDDLQEVVDFHSHLVTEYG